jgi:zinc finger FYVE domain-containing protein 26
MDVLSIEHYFGKEIETSFQQLFIYFCNNINLGQWQVAKACLKQLDANKKSFKYDFDSVLSDIIDNPEVYR